MKTKQLLTCLLLLCMVGAKAQNLISGISISTPTVLPANTADWATALPPVSITAQAKLDSSYQLPGEVIESRILLTIKNGNSKVCGMYSPQNAPNAGFASLVRNWRGGEVDKLLGQTCTLKPGQYTLCVQFFNFESNKAISEERCKPFTVKGETIPPPGSGTGPTNPPVPDEMNYAPPQAIAPANGKVISEKEAKAPLTFRWTPVVPKPREKIIYTVKIIAIPEGLSAAAAQKSSSPIYEKEVTNITQLTAIDFAPTGHTTNYGWYVQAKGLQGKDYGTSGVNGFSTSSTYIISLDSLKVGCPQNGTYTYSIKVGNPNSTIAIFDKLEIVDVNGITLGTPVAITTVTPSYGTAIPAGGSIIASGSFSYSGVVNDFCVKGYIKEQLHPTLNLASTFTCDTLRCICTYCEKPENMKIEDISLTATTVATDNLNIAQHFKITPKNISKINAAIVYMEEGQMDDGCKKCRKDENEVYHFVGTNTATWNTSAAISASPGNSAGSYPSKILDWNSNAQGDLIFNLTVGLPGTAPLSCCNRHGKICIRYSFTDIECKTCPIVVCYTY